MRNAIWITAASFLTIGCSGGDSTSYSLLATGQAFKQSTVNSKVDVLMVVDNSTSMEPLQTNLANNFGSFMAQFMAKRYDYRIAVAATNAYRGGAFFMNDPSLAKFRDGNGTTHSGVFVIDRTTPNPLDVFVTNALIGTTDPASDERAFSSFKEALTNPVNDGFLRKEAFLAIVILSDEDDFSNPTRKAGSYPGGNHDYNDPGLESIQSYVDFLDALKATDGSIKKYSVSAITALEASCKPNTGSILGKRYVELATATDGVVGSICDASFANSLDAIQTRILEHSTQFYLDGDPDPETIQVRVNDKPVKNDSQNGWTYNASTNSIVFHGTAIPTSAADIQVVFDPAGLTF